MHPHAEVTKKQTPPTIKRAANAFAIWRVGKPKGWNISAVEVAKRVGIDPATVRQIAAERKWPIGGKSRNGANHADQIVALDHMIASPDLAMQSLTDYGA
jgi:hypothetical protein